jgi:hypothetical protein
MNGGIGDIGGAGQIAVVLLSLALAYLIYDTYFIGNVEYVKSTVDGREYLVQSLPDKQEAANLLARIRANLKGLVEHVKKIAADDPRTLRIVRNFNPDALSEGTDNTRYTSYSINKGEKIVFCLRARDGSKRLEDLNMMMFVAIHELGHICTEEVGHTPTFWDNFKWLLEHAVNVGLYQKQDFKNKPQEYCGMMVKSNVLN